MRNSRHEDMVLHMNRSVTYWSVSRNQWISRAVSVPDEELAAMRPDNRDKVIAHLNGSSVIGKTTYLE